MLVHGNNKNGALQILEIEVKFAASRVTYYMEEVVYVILVVIGDRRLMCWEVKHSNCEVLCIPRGLRAAVLSGFLFTAITFYPGP